MKTTASEMAQLLFRMAYSSIIRESQDIGAGDSRSLQPPALRKRFDAHALRLAARLHQGIEKMHAGRYRPGDIVLHNHPYYGASHAPDYGVLIPIFFEDFHVGFAGCTGHMVDIGGAHPGFSVDVPDVYAEGKLINAAKIYEAGTRNDALWDHIIENVRTPEANAGDIEALISCCRLGVRRFTELLDRYGLDTVMSACDSWLDYAENRMRRRIRDIPDGIYEAPGGWLEDDGKNFGVPLPIATRVIVDGEDIYVDLSGSSPEVATGFNCPCEGSVLPTVNFAIRTLLLDEAGEGADVPQNDGIFRPVKVYAPEGSIFNPRFPRGCEARFAQINRIPDQILQAFAAAMPTRVTAGNSASVSAIAYAGSKLDDPSQYWVLIEVNEGSYGARWGKDGIDAIDNLMANTRNNPIEEMELSAPVVCERYELRDEAPAAGRWRGGLGSVKRWRFLAPTSIGSTGDHRSGESALRPVRRRERAARRHDPQSGPDGRGRSAGQGQRVRPGSRRYPRNRRHLRRRAGRPIGARSARGGERCRQRADRWRRGTIGLRRCRDGWNAGCDRHRSPAPAVSQGGGGNRAPVTSRRQTPAATVTNG